MVASMEVEFRPRGQGWRGRGRPPRECPAPLLDLLRQAHERREDAAIPVVGTPAREVRQVVALLRRGATQLGYALHIQHDAKEIRFYVEAS